MWYFNNLFLCLLIEPNAPPANVNGHNASSTSIFVSWEQVPFQDQNGVIVSYTVTYRSLPTGSAQTNKVTAPASETTLTGLNEYTNYSITVFASTSNAGGRESTPIVVITDEDSKFEFVIDHPLSAKRVSLKHPIGAPLFFNRSVLPYFIKALDLI